jgi:hypothetical protein
VRLQVGTHRRVLVILEKKNIVCVCILPSSSPWRVAPVAGFTAVGRSVSYTAMTASTVPASRYRRSLSSSSKQFIPPARRVAAPLPGVRLVYTWATLGVTN